MRGIAERGEAKPFTEEAQEPDFVVLGEKIGSHDVAHVSVLQEITTVDGKKIVATVWDRKVSSVVNVVSCFILPWPFFQRRIRSAERKAVQEAAATNFSRVNGTRRASI